MSDVIYPKVKKWLDKKVDCEESDVFPSLSFNIIRNRAADASMSTVCWNCDDTHSLHKIPPAAIAWV